MSLAVRGSIPISLFDRRTAPPTPFSDLSDNPDTPGTTYSFQDPPQHKSANMQAESAHHPLLGPLDHHILPTTDDEMMDSDTDIRKDSDFDIEIDADEVYSNAGGVDLDVNYRMEEDNADNNNHQLYDNDDIMLDEEDDIIFEKQQVDDEADPVPDVIPTSTVPEASLKTPLKEQSTVPEEHSITHSIPPVISEVDQPFLLLEEPSAGETAQLTDSQQTVSPAGESHGALAFPENTEKAIVHEASIQDGDLQHKDNAWSENTSVTLTNEVVPLEEQQANDEATEQPHQSITTGHEVEEEGIVNLANEPPSFDPHPVVVQYEQNHVSLFPPPDDVDLPFFIKDVGVCLRGMNELFSELRNVLDGSVSPGDELVIKIVDYGVEISEDSKSSDEFSLQHILDLHVRLSLQDNIENPEALRLVLFSRPSVSDRINMLLSSANEGLGYNKAIEYARRKLEDSDANSEQRFIEASEGGDLQENEVEDYKNYDSPAPFTHDTDKPAEVEPNPTDNQGSILEQKEEFEEDDDDDDDDFDLEYGNDAIANGVEGEDEGGVNLKDEAPASPSPTAAVSKASPAPINESPNHGPGTPRAQEYAVLEFKTISDSASPRGTQTPDEVEESVSTVQGYEAHSIEEEEEEEELIEYEDYETFGESESHHSPHTVNSESAEQNPDDSAPSPHEVLEQQDTAKPSGTPENYEQESTVNFVDPGDNAVVDGDHIESRSPNEGDVNENNEPSSIPVFEGDVEDEGDYVEEQQEEYGEYEYEGQQGFEAGQDGSRDYLPDDEQYNTQDPEENNHEPKMQRQSHLEQSDQPADDEQNQYLGETAEYEDGYEHYDAEYAGIVNGQEALSGETEYDVGYQIYDLNQAHPRTDYGDDTATGDANESGVAVNSENDETVDSLHAPELVPEVESLLGYDSGEAEHNILPEAKPSTEQKRMHDELEQDEDDDEIIGWSKFSTPSTISSPSSDRTSLRPAKRQRSD
ncbi:hypothetical protein L873DRAFT_1785250 [Choiromyces venosus 120613-1]|uniref:Uncharacterized protein n=1 Tax=Choiromyces venosus 120613-1 TaxID=1336337 RepID=A0A3N4KK10_9PEZI|nr:hypothetical protein L873DRAFT_1785250 [Choiromyces venosus 120613-1]